MEEPGRLQSMELLQVRRDWATSLLLFTFTQWRRQWQPTPVSCLENPRDSRAWWAVVYGVAQSRTRLKRLSSLAASSYKDINPHYRRLHPHDLITSQRPRFLVSPHWVLGLQRGDSEGTRTFRPQHYSHKGTVVLTKGYTPRSMDSAEVSSRASSQLTADKSAKGIHQTKNSPFNKWCRNSWTSVIKNTNLEPYFISLQELTQNRS